MTTEISNDLKIADLTERCETVKRAVDRLEKEIKYLQDHAADSHQKVKPTRFYPNGAYMDEPEEGRHCIFLDTELATNHWQDLHWTGSKIEINLLNSQNCFPNVHTAEKELHRQKLTAKMYRDMRDERINGEWYGNAVFQPRMSIMGDLIPSKEIRGQNPHDFNYKNVTFIPDLKEFCNWTEEELKIVWFGI